MLLEIPSFFFVDEYQVEEISALEPVVYVGVGRRQISAGEVKTDWDLFSFHWGTVHNLKFVQVLGFCDCILAATNYFFFDYAELHVFDFDSNEVEKYFS